MAGPGDQHAYALPRMRFETPPAWVRHAMHILKVTGLEESIRLGQPLCDWSVTS